MHTDTSSNARTTEHCHQPTNPSSVDDQISTHTMVFLVVNSASRPSLHRIASGTVWTTFHANKQFPSHRTAIVGRKGTFADAASCRHYISRTTTCSGLKCQQHVCTSFYAVSPKKHVRQMVHLSLSLHSPLSPPFSTIIMAFGATKTPTQQQ